MAEALDVSTMELARRLGVHKREADRVSNADKSSLVDVDQIELFGKMHAYASKRIAMLMAIREEIDAKLYDDRVRRAANRGRIRNR